RRIAATCYRSTSPRIWKPSMSATKCIPANRWKKKSRCRSDSVYGSRSIRSDRMIISLPSPHGSAISTFRRQHRFAKARHARVGVQTPSDIVRVAAAVIVRADGRVLLAQRPPGKAYAGYWEFPGGKLEPGESAAAALGRELQEELGITVTHAVPWMLQEFVYPHAHVELHFFRVLAWTGEPFGHDGQSFAWQLPGAFDVTPMLPANTRVMAALALPSIYGV